MNRTGIVCTVGPATLQADTLGVLRDAGMTVARLNGSHATLDWHRGAVALIRQRLPDVPILLDIPGRKIRTRTLRREPSFVAGDHIVFTTDPADDGARCVPVDHPSLHEFLTPGDRVFADDGTLAFTVVEVDGREIRCRCENAGTLRSRKGLNIPSVKLWSELVTDRDRSMMVFARDCGVDYVGISFVESREHVEAVAALRNGSWPRIVAKIEHQAGLDNAEEILEAADAVMIDRGDLSIETSLEHTAVFQKRIIEIAQPLGKPVIVATEMLSSMVVNPFPTKAEVSDITNAVLDGCAATMLSAETAIGAHAALAVTTMRRISEAAMEHAHHVAQTRGTNGQAPSSSLALIDAIAMVCRTMPITKIVALTRSGYAARMIAAGRPRQPILAISDDRFAARSFNLFFGTEGLYVDIPFSRTSTDHIPACLQHLWRAGRIVADDILLVTALAYPASGRRANLIQTHRVGDLVESLGWTP